jgi:exodeoxyribonuclease III
VKIATWNINSVRLRAGLVTGFLHDNDIDILCLQETKTQDKDFPKDVFLKAGYNNLFYSGEKSYNGVAIISRVPIEFDRTLNIVNKDKRHISAKIKHGKKIIELHNLYIPAGGDIPDVKQNPKFEHKLNFNKEAATWFSKNGKGKDIIVLGDFNIAPYEHDVWSHKQLLDVVSHTPIEVELLEKFRRSIDFVDIAREFVPQDKKLYSWWSYRNQDWRKSDRGRRLDHIWATEGVAGKVKNFSILKDVRDQIQPSDHVPVVIEL